MERKLCQHGIKLPRGLKCDHGYIQVQLHAKALGSAYYKNFGPHTKDNQSVAEIHLSDKRKELLLGKAGMTPELPEKLFKAVVPLWFAVWKQERDGDGRLMHDDVSIYERERTLKKELIPAFGDIPFHLLKTPKIEDWRESLVIKRGLSGTTVNRYQGPLSAIYTDTIKWVKAGKIKPAFKLPTENPCIAATWAKNKVRKRLFSDYELRKLHMAFVQLNDLDGWEICKLALKSVLSLKDLKQLEIGAVIDTERSKTGVPIRLPITVLTKYDFSNWRKRWEKARGVAGLADAQFRDLRKTGLNNATGRGFDQKLVSQFAGHSSVKTTEAVYQLRVDEKLKPIIEAQDDWVNGL